MRAKTLLILSLIAVGFVSGGCATQPAKVAVSPATLPTYSRNAAAALVFDPPVAMYTAMPNLSREGRSVGAFYGYEQPIVDTYYLQQRDQQRGGNFPDRFDRTAYVGRASVTYR